MSYPFYIVNLNGWKLLKPEDLSNIGHPEFFKDHVAKVLASHHKISYDLIKDLCYSQIRGRFAKPLNTRTSLRVQKMLIAKKMPIPENGIVYIGEDLKKNRFIKEILDKEFPSTLIQHDDHHIMQEDDLIKWESWLSADNYHIPKSTIT